MKASLGRIFEVASNLSGWPKILPHYRWIKYMEQSPTRNVVVMAAWRIVPQLAGIRIPIHWTSEQQISGLRKEIRFHHLKSFSKGMKVVWTFSPTSNGVEVRIAHDFASQVPLLGSLIESIVGRFFVHFVANQTLEHMKAFVENDRGR
jgi:ribosome-associated toxin RatA of RatAB toxin-antitoxin module